MRNVNFQSTKFKKIEDDEVKEKRKREMQLIEKKKILEIGFAEQDGLERRTSAASVIYLGEKSNRDDQNNGLKKELDALIKQNKIKEQEVEKLRELSTKPQGNTNDSTIYSKINNQFDSKSLSKHSGGGRIFSKIFSQSQYRGSSLEFLSGESMLNKEEIEQYLEEIKFQIEDANSNAQNEEERTMTISNQLSQLYTTKQKIKFQLQELEGIQEAADKRFEGIERIEYQAQDKNNQALVQLNKIKEELEDQEQMRQTILSRQEALRDQEKEERKQEEEETGGMMVRIEELSSIFEESKKQLETVIEQEKVILKKRMKSKYILKHIDFFQQFMKIFKQGEVIEDDEELQKIIESMNKESNQNKQHSPTALLESDMGSQRELEGELVTQTSKDAYSTKHVTLHSNTHQDHEGDNNNHKDDILERSLLIAKIDTFLNGYPNGLDECVGKVLKLLNRYRYQDEAYNSVYEQQLSLKVEKVNELERLREILDELKKNNLFVSEMNEDVTVQNKIESIQESLDSGYLKIKQTGGEQDQSDFKHTTINIEKIEVRQNQNEIGRLIREIQWRKNFFFNFFMNYGEWILRMCRIIKDIFKEVLGQASQNSVLQKKCDNAWNYIQSLWKLNIQELPEINFGLLPPRISEEKQIQILEEDPSKENGSKSFIEGKQNPNFLNIGQSGQRRSSKQSIRKSIKGDQNSLSNFIENTVSINLKNNPKKIQKFNKTVLEKFKVEEIQDLFQDIFEGQTVEASREFFSLLKQDRLVWFFCDLECIENYLQGKATHQDLNKTKNASYAVDNFIELEVIAVQECGYKLNEMYNYFTGILQQLYQESQEINESIKKQKKETEKRGQDTTLERRSLSDQSEQQQQQQQQSQNKGDLKQNLKVQAAIQLAINRQLEYMSEGKEEDLDSENTEEKNKKKKQQEEEGEEGEEGANRENVKYQRILDFIQSQNTSSNRNKQITINKKINQKIKFKGDLPNIKSTPLNANIIHNSNSQGSSQLQSQQQTDSNQNQAQLNQQVSQESQANQQQQSQQSQKQGIIKKGANRKLLEFKTAVDLAEDKFIEEEAQKQKEKEKLSRMNNLAKDAQLTSLQQASNKSTKAQYLSPNRLSECSQSEETHRNYLHQMASNHILMQKIEILDRKYNTSAPAEQLLNELKLQTLKTNQQLNENSNTMMCNLNQLNLQNSSQYSYLKTTASMESRKKAVVDTLKDISLLKKQLSQTNSNSQFTKTSSDHFLHKSPSQRVSQVIEGNPYILNPQSSKQSSRSFINPKQQMPPISPQPKNPMHAKIQKETQQNKYLEKSQSQWNQSLSDSKKQNNFMIPSSFTHRSKLNNLIGFNTNNSHSQKQSISNVSNSFNGKKIQINKSSSDLGRQLQADEQLQRMKLQQASDFKDFPYFQDSTSNNFAHQSSLYSLLHPTSFNSFAPTGILTNPNLYYISPTKLV